MDTINSYLRKVFLFIFAFYPWVNYFLKKVPKLGSVWDDLLIFAFVLFSILLGYRRLKELLNLPTVLFSILFATVSIFSFVFNNYLFLAFQHQLRLFLEPFIVFIGIYLINPTKNEVEFYLKNLAISTALLGFHGIYQYIVKVPTPSMWVDKELERSSIYTRAFSVVNSPNVLAGYLEIGLPVAVYLVWEKQNSLKKAFYSVLTLGIVFGLFLTFSRGGWIGGFSSLFLAFVVVSPVVGIGLILLLGITLFAVPILRLRVLSLIDPSYIQKSLEAGGRLFRWKYGVNNGFEHPLFGTGLGTFGGSAAQKYGYFSYTSMDSVYINVFAETGFLGIVSFLLWVFYGFVNYFVKFLDRRKFIYLFLGASLFAILVHMFVENLFNVWGLTSNFWIISALSEVIDE